MNSPVLEGVDAEVRAIFENSKWPWDPWQQVFRRARRRGESQIDYHRLLSAVPCPIVITIEELEEHRLYSEPQDDELPPKEKNEALNWLRLRIAEAEPKR